MMKYPKELDQILKQELTNLINMKKANLGPFAEGIIQKYHEKYEKMKKM